MDHAELEALLGAYALDAVEGPEASELEAHLATCPRCRAELEAHRQVAALLGDAGADAPAGVWERIADGLSAEGPPPGLPSLISGKAGAGRRRRLRGRAGYVAAGLAAAAAVTVALLAVQVNHLSNEVNGYQAAPTAISAAARAALASTHQTVVLTSSAHREGAEVVVTPDGTAYWFRSSLPRLTSLATYQLWALVAGKIVSVGLLGPDPARAAVFRIGPGTSRLMVTREPASGVPLPTTPVLLAGSTV